MGVPYGTHETGLAPIHERVERDRAFVYRRDPVSRVGPLCGPTHRRHIVLWHAGLPSLQLVVSARVFLRDSVPL